MSRNLAALAARYSGRPLLMTQGAAHDLAMRLRQVDARAFERPSRIEALLRKLSGGRPSGPAAMEDADAEALAGPSQAERLAYVPLFVGEPDDIGYGWSLVDGVAMICADKPLLAVGESYCGEMYHGYDTLKAAMREASADNRVRAIFLRLSSPGGVVDGRLDDLAAWMRANRASAGGKPIWVYADMAASAAYWIAAQADRIIAPRTGLVGSIGAVIVHENYAAALAEAGIEITPIQFGSLKTDGAWWAKLSPTARDAFQSEIDQCGRNFVADVVAGRPAVTEEAALATQAECYLASHDDPARSGLALQLVDEISSEEDAFFALRDLVAEPVSAPAPVQPSSATAAGGRVASLPSQEKPMAGKAPTEAGRQAALSRARLAKARADAEVARLEAEGGEDQGGGEDDPVDPPELPDEENQPEVGEQVVEPEAALIDATTASAILKLPEAKGRDKLAQTLALTPGMTVDQAKTLLAAAPRGNALADRMVGADPAVTGSGGPPTAKASLSTGERFEMNRQAGLKTRGSRR